MRRQSGPGIAFITIGAAFFAIGRSGHRVPFLAIGLAFVVIGMILLIRQRRADGSK